MVRIGITVKMRITIPKMIRERIRKRKINTEKEKGEEKEMK